MMPPRLSAGLDRFGERRTRVPIGVKSIAVGGFEEQDVGAGIGLRFAQDRDAVAADIAGEIHRLPIAAGDLGLELDGGGAENVALPVEAEPDAGAELVPLVERNRLEELEGGPGVRRAEERQRGLVLRVALLVGVAGLLFLDVGGVGEEDAEQIPGRRGAVDGAVEALAHQPGQPAGVVDVGVGQDDSVDIRRAGRGEVSSCAGGSRRDPGRARSRPWRCSSSTRAGTSNP